MQKGQHRQKLINLLKQYPATTALSDDLLDRFIEHATRRVVRALIINKEAEFRKSIVVAHGDPLPEDWGSYAGASWYTLNGEKRPVLFIDTPEIAWKPVAKFNKASRFRPCFYITNQTFKFFPDTSMIDPLTEVPYAANMTAVTIWYYYMPQIIAGEDILDSTEDNLPEFTQPLIHAAALESALEIIFDEAKAIQQLEKNFTESLQSNVAYFTGLYGEQSKSYEN